MINLLNVKFAHLKYVVNDYFEVAIDMSYQNQGNSQQKTDWKKMEGIY
jgi:hypothetical protein